MKIRTARPGRVVVLALRGHDPTRPGVLDVLEAPVAVGAAGEGHPREVLARLDAAVPRPGLAEGVGLEIARRDCLDGRRRLLLRRGARRKRQREEGDQADHKAPMAVRARRTSSMPSGVRGSCGARGGPTA